MVDLDPKTRKIYGMHCVTRSRLWINWLTNIKRKMLIKEPEKGCFSIKNELVVHLKNDKTMILYLVTTFAIVAVRI
jgi:hypothetical protein